MITNLNTAGSWAGSIFDDYQEKMESPEMTSLGDQATEKQEEIEKVQADIDSMKKQVEANMNEHELVELKLMLLSLIEHMIYNYN